MCYNFLCCSSGDTIFCFLPCYAVKTMKFDLTVGNVQRVHIQIRIWTGTLISYMGIMGDVLCCWHASVWEFNVGDVFK